MKILVTGAAGYLGSVLVPRLLGSGHQVIALDNFMFNQNSLLDCCHDKNLEIIRNDVRDKALLKKLVNSADAIFPLACLTGAPLCDKNPFDANAIIVEQIQTIICARSKDQMIIYPTTNSGYGIGKPGCFCTEDTELNPISLYGQLKVSAEKMLLEAGQCISFRLATAFGVSPRMRIDLLVNDFVSRAVFDKYVILFEPHFKRNYIHVQDVAKAFLHGLTNFDRMKNQVYNVGLSQANLSKWQLCEEIKKQIPDFYFVEAAVGQDPDKRDYVISNEKIEQTGFKPDVSLQEGIKELIKGYQVIRKNQYGNV